MPQRGMGNIPHKNVSHCTSHDMCKGTVASQCSYLICALACYGAFHIYQLAFLTPGNKPLEARSLIMIRDILK